MKHKLMKKGISSRPKTAAQEEHSVMLPEYDFTKMKGGVRGKYFSAYRAGHTIKIHNADGTTEVQRFRPAPGSVTLDPDVMAYFPDAASVNDALRCLIPLISKRKRSNAKA